MEEFIIHFKQYKSIPSTNCFPEPILTAGLDVTFCVPGDLYCSTITAMGDFWPLHTGASVDISCTTLSTQAGLYRRYNTHLHFIYKPSK